MSTQSQEPPLEEAVRGLVEQGITTRVGQARALGLPLSTYMYRLRRDDLIVRPSLSEWIPWTVTREHHGRAVARHLRLLAQAAEGRNPKKRLPRGKAVKWAQGLVDGGLDVTYSPSVGWGTKRANPQDWYIRRLLEAAQRHILSLPQLDDLGERHET